MMSSGTSKKAKNQSDASAARRAPFRDSRPVVNRATRRAIRAVSVLVAMDYSDVRSNHSGWYLLMRAWKPTSLGRSHRAHVSGSLMFGERRASSVMIQVLPVLQIGVGGAYAPFACSRFQK